MKLLGKIDILLLPKTFRKSQWKLSNLMKMIYKNKIAGADAVKFKLMRLTV